MDGERPGPAAPGHPTAGAPSPPWPLCASPGPGPGVLLRLQSTSPHPPRPAEAGDPAQARGPQSRDCWPAEAAHGELVKGSTRDEPSGPPEVNSLQEKQASLLFWFFFPLWDVQFAFPPQACCTETCSSALAQAQVPPWDRSGSGAGGKSDSFHIFSSSVLRAKQLCQMANPQPQKNRFPPKGTIF